jgi:50S ribosomal protein L16 3-hydroxylase
MLNFQKISLKEFLTQFWQKKSLLIPAALPHFKNHLSADELAGLAMEEEIESRLVIHTPGEVSKWTLKRGPFTKSAFKKLPKSHWTLLVQGVDRFIPEITCLLDSFNFIPQWRVDDVMISYAVEHGSVGPHYDNYDVFLYQAKGRRKWLLTTKNCIESNYLKDVDLRIMNEFKTEKEYILEEGDMLYLPANVGHHGISLSNDCITYSFGYRSYQTQELWDSFGEYLSSKNIAPLFYQDPPWTVLSETSQIPQQAWHKAKAVLQAILDDDTLVEDWFGLFATQLDRHAESLLPLDSENEPVDGRASFKLDLLNSSGLVRNPLCRFAYIKSDSPPLSLYINGCKWCIDGVAETLVETIANNRTVLIQKILPFIDSSTNESFLYELWKLQWLEFVEKECSE